MDFEELERKMLELNRSQAFFSRVQPAKGNLKPSAYTNRSVLERKTRYLQIAFNYDTFTVQRVLPQVPQNPRILIEAGTPYIKRNGMDGIRLIRQLWRGLIVADLKIMDGALGEVNDALNAGADAVTVAGAAPFETIQLVVEECKKRGAISMVDMINVEEPLRVLMKARATPDVVVLHRGRDEENTRGKVIQYKQIKRIRSKFDTLISAAGGVDLKEAQSASFNGANIVVVNIVHPSDPWTGIDSDAEITEIANRFLKTIQ